MHKSKDIFYFYLSKQTDLVETRQYHRIKKQGRGEKKDKNCGCILIFMLLSEGKQGVGLGLVGLYSACKTTWRILRVCMLIGSGGKRRCEDLI